MKKLVILLLSLSVLIVVAACGDQSEENNETTTDEPTEQQEDNHNQDESEDTENDGEEEDDSDSTEDGSDGEYLRLGETGVMETIIGDYEVTPKAVRYVSAITEDDSEIAPFSDTFVVIDTTITNIGDETMQAEDAISQAVLREPATGGGVGPDIEFASIENIEGELISGETIEGEMVFDSGLVEEYDLSFGSLDLESASNELTWKIYGDEIDSE